VWSVTHKSGEFHIFTAEPMSREDRLKHERRVTCKGWLFGIQGVAPGVPLELFGKWVMHPKYGKQFDFNGWAPWADSSVGVESFMRNCLGVVDEVRIAILVDAFGVDSFRVLTESPERLLGLDGFDEATCLSLTTAWAYARVSSELSTYFSGHDITSAQMKLVFQAFGADAKKIVEDNPYRLLELEGFLFNRVDEVARAQGVSSIDPRRFEGAVLWVLREAAQSGHLCVRRGELGSQLRELVRVSSVDSFDDPTAVRDPDISSELQQAVSRLEARKKVVVDTEVGVYLPNNYRNERDSARYLAGFITPVRLEVNLEEFLVSYETMHRISLSEAQKDAVEKLISNRVLALTGLPGTGKTTVVRTFVELFEKAGISYVLMAPTGIASKRLASVTGREAATIHRTFRYNGEEWGYGQDSKYPIGAVIVDEMSMVDQELFFRILDALVEGTFLVFVGDDAQLPSVGPGSVLRELVRCSAVPTVRLTQIFRQAEKSEIVLNSHRINRGEPIKPGDPSSDFSFIPVQEEEKIAPLIVQMAAKLKGRDANFQVLSPKYDGAVGVTNLNNLLREKLNPPDESKREFSLGDLRFREGDRLMVIKNDYELGVYNGDMGKLVRVLRDILVVRIHGIGEDGLDVLVEFPRNEALIKLRLAYAITVHKSQGSEFDTVILPIVRAQGRMLQRNLFYTAVTRAKRKVWLLGDRIAVQRAIDNDKVVLRTTGFEQAILRSMEELHSVLLTGVEEPDGQGVDRREEASCTQASV
jgi:exodeoxyribonuclease V alpha subunit